MPILNPSFEDAGAEPGLAAHWTLRTFVARERIAGFGPVPYRGRDDFERWSGWIDTLAEAAPVVGVFEPLREAFESFEGGWANDAFALELPLGAVVLASFDIDDVEAFEVGWSRGPFLGTWGDVIATAGRFGTETAEAFATGWRGNERFLWGWVALTTIEAAAFDGAGAESFEGTDWTPVTI